MPHSETSAPTGVAIVPAAGRGTRMATEVKKTYLELAGRPLIVHTLARLRATPEIERIVLVVASEDQEACREEIVRNHGFEGFVEVVAGGSSRQESVFLGLHAVPPTVRYVVVHDGARPLVTGEMVRAALAAARDVGAATVAVPVKDTLKKGDAEHFTESTVDREWLWRIQTPQAFRRDLLWSAHVEAQSRGLVATDDATLIETVGGRVRLVPGDERNIKVTTPDDLALVEALLAAESRSIQADENAPEGEMLEIRTGLGYDIHPLAENRRLILGGVEIPHTRGLAGHSDADALTHAICDALLGAAALGDIGTHFPDTDPRFRNVDSLELLAEVVALVRREFEIVHVDTTVKAQAPKLGPHIPAIRSRLADVLGVPVSSVNVKAKTGERMGPVGEGRAIETEAVATLRRRGLQQ